MSAIENEQPGYPDALGFLTNIYAAIDEGWVTICHTENGNMMVDWFPIGSLGAAARKATTLRHDVWFGIAPRRERLVGGLRGGVTDCSHVVALPLDIDVAGPGHKGEGLAATLADARRCVEQFPVPPTVLVNSGGGLQAWWFLSEPIEADDPEAMRLLSCWRDTWMTIGARLGVKVDNVFDVPRIMRLPGTSNYKTGTARPVVVVEADYTRRFGLDDLEPYFLEAPTVEPLPRRGSTYNGAERPGDWFNATAQWADLLGGYGWTFHSRKSDGEELWVRPGKERRDGVSASLYYKGSDVLKVFTDGAAPLKALDTYDKFGFLAAMTRNGDIQQTTRDVRAMMANEQTDVFRPTTPARHLAAVPTGGDVPPPPRAKHKVIISSRHLNELLDEITAELVAHNDPPTTFVRAGHPARIRADENGRPIIEQLEAEQLRVQAADVMEFGKLTKDGGYQPTEPQLAHMRSVLALGQWGFPALVGITETPIMRPDGTFRTEAGYDPATRLYHWSHAEYPAIAEAPSPEELAGAVAAIDDILCDFPFDTTADRANAWALLLTSIVRPAVVGQVPLALLDAPEPGTGKSLLATIISLVATGRYGAMQALPDRDEELEKRITSLLMAGTTAVIFDNVEGTIRSPILAGALTADVWQGRVLGVSQIVEVPSRVTWMATGNNIDVGGDLARRCYRIRLDAHTAQPWKRTEFRHSDLIGHVSANRPKIVAALCTMVRSWVTAGKPKPAQGTPAMGGYRPWVELVGGILEHCGVSGFLANSDEFHSTADREAQGWEAFLTAWRDSWGNSPMTIGEVVKDMADQYKPRAQAAAEALPDDLAPWRGTERLSVRLGQALSKKSGRHYGDEGLHVVKCGRDRNKVVRYAVEVRSAGVGSATPAGAGSSTSTFTNAAGVAGVKQQPDVSVSANAIGAGESPEQPPQPPQPPRRRPFLDEDF